MTKASLVFAAAAAISGGAGRGGVLAESSSSSAAATVVSAKPASGVASVGGGPVDPLRDGIGGGGDKKMRDFIFRRDVVRRAEQRAKSLAAEAGGGGGGGGTRRGAWMPSSSASAPSAEAERELLQKAVPLKEYNARVVARGGRPIELDGEGGDRDDGGVPDFMKAPSHRHRHRRLEDDGAVDDDDDAAADENEDGNGDGNDDGDDYYMDPNYTNDFTGYSLKFATCQKVQRFSNAAVYANEYSALVVDDIVVLRLCPKRRCKESYQYGCYSGYGEYAIGVAEYLRVMMNHEVDKQNNLCGFCAACQYGTEDSYGGYDGYYANKNGGGRERARHRRLDDGGDGNGDDDAADDYFAAGDDGAVAGDDDLYGDDDAAAAGDDAATDDGGGAQTVCDTYADLCDEYYGTCSGNVDDDGERDGMERLDYLDYLDYFDCVQVEGNDKYDYWISPRCDPYSSKITMGLFYDKYCSQYAGNELNINGVTDIYFQNDIFEDFHTGECIECASSAYPPYYNANNNMCNAMYDKSAKCNTYFAYDLSATQDDDGVDNGGSSGICSFTESIREGTYDATGQVKIKNSFSTGQDAEVTKDQIVMLAVSATLCVLLAVYACFIHHEITNLLLKSLAHGHLIRGGSDTTAGGGDRVGRTRTEDMTSDDDDMSEEVSVRRDRDERRNRSGSRRTPSGRTPSGRTPSGGRRGGGGDERFGSRGSGRRSGGGRSRSRRYEDDDDDDWDRRGEYA